MRRLFPVTEETPGRMGRREAGQPIAADPASWDLDDLAEAYVYPEPVQASEPQPMPEQASEPEAAPAHEPKPKAPGTEAPGTEAPGTEAPGTVSRPVWLRANMVSSLDGAGQHDGRSQPLSCEADMRIFGVLRALADVVIVGAQTVRCERYRPARARPHFAARRAAAGQSPVPAIAVVTAGMDLDFSLPLFTEPLVPTLVITGAEAPADRVAAARRAGAEVVIAGEGAGVEPQQVVAALAERGYARLLLEGGPRLLGQFVAVGALDELCLTLSPLLTAGQAQRIAGGPAVPVPDRLELVSVLEEDGFLFTRYRRTQPPADSDTVEEPAGSQE